MKNKKLIILFLVFLVLILPLERVYASLWDSIKKGVSGFFNWIGGVIKSVTECIGNPIFCGLSLFIYLITWVFHQILYFLNLHIFAPLVDKASQINPFATSTKEAVSPAEATWNILKSYGFIILVFSALAAAYEWLIGDDASAKRLIFNIIVVALIISFTFVLIEEAFKVVRSFEKGITNNQSEKIGTIMAASLWQKNPFKEIDEIAATINERGTTFKYLTESILYIFIIVFDMGMFIILIVALVLFIARYFYILALTAVSSIAVASATFPEFKGSLARVFSNLRFTSEWFANLVKWLLVVPIFVTLVLLCNITKENILAQIGEGDFMQFIMLFLGFTVCYAGSLKVAVSLGGFAAAWAKGIATAFLLAIGGATAKGILGATQGTVGEILKKAGGKIEEKVGVGGVLG